jgi:sulfonate transport system substrate-binding protein
MPGTGWVWNLVGEAGAADGWKLRARLRNKILLCAGYRIFFSVDHPYLTGLWNKYSASWEQAACGAQPVQPAAALDFAGRTRASGMELIMTEISRRSLLASALLVALLPGATVRAADKPKEIRIDWATYNPVSILLKNKGLLEKEFARDGIAIVWVQTVSSANALQFLNAGSIEFGSTAGSAALIARVNGNPIKSVYVFSRPEWTALVTTRDSKINRIEDLKGKKVAMVRGTDPHIFLVRALLSVGMTDKDITPVLVQQHADGGTALLRGDVDAWAGLDPMMAQKEIEDGARLFYRNAAANTWGILNAREEFIKDQPDIVRRVLAVYEEARKYSLSHYDELKRDFIAVTKLPENVVDKQLKERTELTHSKIGLPQRDSILEAGLALQKAGVIGPAVDVKKAVDDLIDDRYVTAAN